MFSTADIFYMRKILLTAFFISLTLRLLAQQIILSGHITDQNGHPVPFASVYVQNSSYGTTANENGDYILKLSNGSYDLVYRFVGFKTVVEHLQISASNSLSSFDFQTLYANTNFQNASLHTDIHTRLNKYFNTADFSQPAAFTLGNGPAYYNNLRAPGLDSTDLSLFKEFATIERVKVQFRTELFNAFNHAQFGSPDTGVTDASFGQITSQANSPRQIQFGLKLLY